MGFFSGLIHSLQKGEDKTDTADTIIPLNPSSIIPKIQKVHKNTTIDINSDNSTIASTLSTLSGLTINDPLVVNLSNQILLVNQTEEKKFDFYISKDVNNIGIVNASMLYLGFKIGKTSAQIIIDLDQATASATVSTNMNHYLKSYTHYGSGGDIVHWQGTTVVARGVTQDEIVLIQNVLKTALQNS